jgi:xyloglucan-specific exo-beta-1,4-glucanase
MMAASFQLGGGIHRFFLAILFALAAWLGVNQDACALTFGNVAMGGGGYVTGIIGCPGQSNLFYCKTDVGGAYRWDETNQAWIPLLDWNSQEETSYQGVEALALDPQSPEKLYLLAGTSYWNSGKTAILRSTNYGDTFAITDVSAKFKAHGNGADRQKGEALAVDPHLGSILFCGTRWNGLFKSADSGVTWNAVTSLNSNLNVATDSISFVIFDRFTGSGGNATPRIFAGVFRTGTNLFVSNDAGNTWIALTNSPAASLPQRCALAADNSLYITYGNDTNGALMRYTTTNGFWTNCSPSGTKTYCGISVSSADPKKLVATSYNRWDWQPWGAWGDRIYVSTNSGASWVDLFGGNKATNNANGFPYIATASIHWAGALEMDPFNPNRVFVGSGNGIFCTTNLNSGLTRSTWKFMVKGLEEIVPLDFVSVPNGPLLSSVGDQGGFIHTDITVSPAAGNMSQSTSFAYAAKKTNFICRVVQNGEVWYSRQLPVTWVKMPSTPEILTNGKVAVSCDGATVLWKSTVGSIHTNYVTTNFGTNWIAGTNLNFNCIPVADPENPKKFYAYNSSDGFLYVSTNGGLGFAPSGSAGTGGSLLFRVAPGWEGHLWIARGGNGLKYSTNSGANFYDRGVNTCDAVAFGKTIPGATYPTLFIWGKPTSASTAGMYRSTDLGVTWLRVNDDAHEYGGRGNAGLIEGDKNIHGRVYMSSAGRGVVVMDSTVPVTGVTVTPATNATFVTGTRQLASNLQPANPTYPAISWTSSDTNIATVNSSGLITGVAPGTNTITVATLDGGHTVSAVVIVTNLATAPILSSTFSSATSIVMSWPADHRGWLLQVQTNPLVAGLGTNWVAVPGSTSANRVTNSVSPANGSVFYRLALPD